MGQGHPMPQSTDLLPGKKESVDWDTIEPELESAFAAGSEEKQA